MARPGPKILLDKHLDDRIVEILATDAMWAVCYQGEPVGMRELRWSPSMGRVMEYPKVSYANRGHCINLVEKLNSMFDTTDFTCEQLLAKQQIDTGIKVPYNVKNTLNITV
jgi:hypothetical protein